MMTTTDADKSFYEWFLVSGKYSVQLETLREAFAAGWIAHMKADGDG